MFSAGSEVLATATQFTHNPVHFSQVTIVLPEFWSETECGETIMKPTGNTLYKHPDMLITSSGLQDMEYILSQIQIEVKVWTAK